jgi:hypothetical protein
MPTFIYSPGVKVFIQTEKSGLVDISEDLVEGTMQRRGDGISTFQFSVSNPQRKYDSVFTPNDRIVVMMKRLAWVRTYTGLLNSVPLITAWPMVVPLTSSCSLKRLQYWYWDANAPVTQQMIRDALTASINLSGNTDGGITNVILTILDKVVGWPASKVHIGQIPSNWFDIAKKIAQDVDALATESDSLAAEFKATLNASGVIAGGSATTGAAVNGKLTPGTYGGFDMTADKCKIAETIYTTCISLGGSQRDGICGITCGIDESGLYNNPGGDRDSVGVFQQRPSQGWGTVAECMDVAHAATSFYKQFLQLSNRDSMSVGQAIQTVQRSGTADGSNYTKCEPAGTAIVHALITSPGAAATPATPGKSASPSSTTGKSTGYALAQQGCDFVSKWPAVPYGNSTGRDIASLLKEPPSSLDCSAFVLAMYLRLLGGAYGMAPQTDAMVTWCQTAKAKKLTAKEAFAIPGAVVFVGSPGATTHVEITLGDGTRTVGARSGMASVLDWGNSDYFNFGYQLPNLSYDGQTAVVAGAAAGSNPAQGQVTSVLANTLPGYNANDPFDKMFGDNAWVPIGGADSPDMLLAESLTGIRALLNDQPVMQYFMNLFNSEMRSFCSAPNGDLIAWFPDYYGIWGTAAKMIIEPIEVQDFNVQWSDDFFVTHQFTVAGATVNHLNVMDGTVAPSFLADLAAKTETLGIASIDIPALMYALFGIDATKGEANTFAANIYKRFGARPAYQQMPGLVGPKAAFFSAIYMFMRAWAYQYNADIPLTFMPELYPGMLIQIPKFDFQAYVTTVTHTFRFGKGGGFGTTVNISSPARLPKKAGDRDGVLIGLPLAGDYKPGRGVGNVDPLAVEGL